MGTVSSIIVLVSFAVVAAASVAAACICGTMRTRGRGKPVFPDELLLNLVDRVKPAMKLREAVALLTHASWPPPGFCVITGSKRDLPISIGNEKTVKVSLGAFVNFRARVVVQTPWSIYDWECKHVPLHRLLEDVTATPINKHRPWINFSLRSAVTLPPALSYNDLNLFSARSWTVYTFVLAISGATGLIACASLYQTSTFARLPSGYLANGWYWLLVTALLISEQLLTCNWTAATYYPTIWTTCMALVATVMINVLLATNVLPMWVDIILLLSVAVFWAVAIFRCYAMHRDPTLRNSGSHQLRSVRRNMYIGVSVLSAFYTLLSIAGLSRLGSLGMAVDWLLKLVFYNLTAHIVLFLGTRVARKTQKYYLAQMVGDLRGLMIENGIPIPVDSKEDQVKVSLVSQEDHDEGEDSSIEEPNVSTDFNVASTRSVENSVPLSVVVQQVTPPPPPITSIAPGSGNLRAFL